MGKSEGKRPLGRPRRWYEGNIKMDLREFDCDPGDCVDLAEERGQYRAYVRAVMNRRVLWGEEGLKFSTSTNFHQLASNFKQRFMRDSTHSMPNFNSLNQLVS